MSFGKTGPAAVPRLDHLRYPCPAIFRLLGKGLMYDYLANCVFKCLCKCGFLEFCAAVPAQISAPTSLQLFGTKKPKPNHPAPTTF